MSPDGSPGGSQPPARGTATRAEGEKPDDRSLETAAHPLGTVFLGRGGRCDRDGLDARSQVRDRSAQAGPEPRPPRGGSKTPRSTTSRPSSSKARTPRSTRRFANLYRDWCKAAPADRRDALEAERTDHLVKAVKFDKSARGPRIQLLEEAMAHDNPADSVYWAREAAQGRSRERRGSLRAGIRGARDPVAEHPGGPAASQGAGGEAGLADPRAADQGQAGPGDRRRQGA